ncbi:nucleotidyltransferase domain-containing protein [Halobacillus litoralis]|uniref:nucleotidyltransferase domain-containing protein n=1 Tax=Halobacillus litoralis TaxID=45668 RepID=UPI001CFD4445|nr:nucleotidyltransferase domain-containing protein [Halobacillus litoralis]
MIVKELINDITARLKEKYQCHTVILYGSYMTGDYTKESDIDLLGFTDTTEQEENEVDLFQGKQLDVWVHPTPHMDNPGRFLKAHQGQIVLDEKGKAALFLSEVHRVFEEGPKKLSGEEKTFLRTWLRKMEVRSQKGDLEGNYRFHWMLKDSLEIYFELNDRWYLGPKKSFEWLKKNDPEAHDLFQRSLQESWEKDHVSRLINYITSE